MINSKVKIDTYDYGTQIAIGFCVYKNKKIIYRIGYEINPYAMKKKCEEIIENRKLIFGNEDKYNKIKKLRKHNNKLKGR